jgi:hypothetical protein
MKIGFVHRNNAAFTRTSISRRIPRSRELARHQRRRHIPSKTRRLDFVPFGIRRHSMERRTVRAKDRGPPRTQPTAKVMTPTLNFR